MPGEQIGHVENPRLLGHRGTQEMFTENGIQAFEYSLSHGITGFETDFRLTADGVVVVMHDADIKRTTNGEGIVENMTLAQVKQYTLKKSNESVPTADELFSLFDNRRGFYIELEMKARYGQGYDEARMDEYLNKLHDAAKAHLEGGTYVFTCFDTSILKRLKALHPQAKVGLILGVLTQELLDAAKDAQCYSIAPTLAGTEQSLVDQAKAAGMKVNLWHAETLELWKRIREMGADVCTTNHPVEVLENIHRSVN